MNSADDSLSSALAKLSQRDAELGATAAHQADEYRRTLNHVDVPYVFPDSSKNQNVYAMPYHRSMWKFFIHLSVFSPIRKKWHALLRNRRGA